MKMKNNGFTLIEYLTYIILTLSLVILLSKISLVFISSMKVASININQRENAQVIEKLIKNELDENSIISSVYIKNIGKVNLDSFSSGDILLVYYKTKSADMQVRYNAINFKSDTKKILIRKNLLSENLAIDSIGGYEIAAGVKKCYLEKSSEKYKFVIELIDNNNIYIKEIFIDKTNHNL